MNENMNNNPMEVMGNEVEDWTFDKKSGLIGFGIGVGVVFGISGAKILGRKIKNKFFNKAVDTEVEVDDFDDYFEDDDDKNQEDGQANKK